MTPQPWEQFGTEAATIGRVLDTVDAEIRHQEQVATRAAALLPGQLGEAVSELIESSLAPVKRS